MEPSKIIGQNIRICRQSKGIKQEVPAKHLAITKGRMSQIENGDCRELTLNRILQIAKYIDVSVFDLFSPSKEITQNIY